MLAGLETVGSGSICGSNSRGALGSTSPGVDDTSDRAGLPITSGCGYSSGKATTCAGCAAVTTETASPVVAASCWAVSTAPGCIGSDVELETDDARGRVAADGVVRPLREAALERLAERERLAAGPACSIETRSLPRLATCCLGCGGGEVGVSDLDLPRPRELANDSVPSSASMSGCISRAVAACCFAACAVMTVLYSRLPCSSRSGRPMLASTYRSSSVVLCEVGRVARNGQISGGSGSPRLRSLASLSLRRQYFISCNVRTRRPIGRSLSQHQRVAPVLRLGPS